MSILMKILKLLSRQFNCASVGEEINFDSIKMHGMRVKEEEEKLRDLILLSSNLYHLRSLLEPLTFQAWPILL